MGDITGANASIAITIPPIFTTPQPLQGFAVDDIYDIDEIDSVETLMGVDGVLSGGYVFKTFMQRIMLQADSPSNVIFDTWWSQMTAAKAAFAASAVIRLPALGIKFVQSTGYLRGYKQPGVKRLVQPRTYRIEWALSLPNPI